MPPASASKEATVRELAGLDREVTPKVTHHSAICTPYSMSPKHSPVSRWTWETRAEQPGSSTCEAHFTAAACRSWQCFVSILGAF